MTKIHIKGTKLQLIIRLIMQVTILLILAYIGSKYYWLDLYDIRVNNTELQTITILVMAALVIIACLFCLDASYGILPSTQEDDDNKNFRITKIGNLICMCCMLISIIIENIAWGNTIVDQNVLIIEAIMFIIALADARSLYEKPIIYFE